MSTLYLISAGSYDGTFVTIPIYANNEAQVGKYIRNNLDKFMYIFESLWFSNEYRGAIGEGLSDIYDEINSASEFDSPEMVEKIRKVIASYDDKTLVNGLWGYEKDAEGSWVSINKMPADQVVKL